MLHKCAWETAASRGLYRVLQKNARIPKKIMTPPITPTETATAVSVLTGTPKIKCDAVSLSVGCKSIILYECTERAINDARQDKRCLFD